MTHKQYRPWHKDEVPVGAIYRRRADPEDQFMICTNSTVFSSQEAFEGFEVSYDYAERMRDKSLRGFTTPPTWHPCGVLLSASEEPSPALETLDQMRERIRREGLLGSTELYSPEEIAEIAEKIKEAKEILDNPNKKHTPVPSLAEDAMASAIIQGETPPTFPEAIEGALGIILRITSPSGTLQGGLFHSLDQIRGHEESLVIWFGATELDTAGELRDSLLSILHRAGRIYKTTDGFYTPL